MKKGRILKILFTLIMVISFGKVKAYYNPGGGVYSTGSHGTTAACGTGYDYCQNNNRGPYQIEPALKLTLYYINSEKNTLKTIGSPKYISFTDRTTKRLNEMYNISSSNIIRINGYTVNKGDFVAAYKALRNYYGDTNENVNNVANSNLKKLLNTLSGGDYTKVLTEDTQNADPTGKNPAKYGYRIIIEPVVYYGSDVILTPIEAAYYNSIKGKVFSTASFPITLKQYENSDTATKAKNDICVKKSGGSCVQKGSQAGFLFTSYDDVGIKATTRSGSKNSQSACDNISVEELSDRTRGCGMNIIDIGKYIAPPPCYDVSTKKVSGELTCKETDKNNESSFTEVYNKRNCTLEESKKNTNTKDGKLVKELDNCSVYCIESAKASLPGHIGDSFSLGYGNKITGNTYFAWPARKGSKTGMQMYMSSTYTCTIVNKTGKTCSNDNIKTLTDAAKSTVSKLEMGAKVKGGNFNELNGQSLNVISDDVKITYPNSKDTKKFSATKLSYLEIPENVNRYFNKAKGTVSNTIPNTTEYYDRKQGVISLNEKSTPEGKYELSLKDLKLGSGNQFGKYITKYVCYYTVSKIPPCKCPAGTLREGSEIYVNITQGKTCAQLLKTQCDCVCPEDSNYENIGKVLGDKNSIETTEQCRQLQQKFCYKQKCTKPDGTDVDITGCVRTEVEKNKRSTAEAIAICEDKPEYGCKKSYCDAIKNSKELIEEYEDCKKNYKESYCFNYYCSCPDGCCGKTCKYYCYTSENEKVDISDCVAKENVNGKRLIEAKDICTSKEKKCNTGGKGPCTNNCTFTTRKEGNKTIATTTCDDASGKGREVCDEHEVCMPGTCLKPVVYRTIDLDNPFPANNKNGVTTKFSNTGTLGRMPKNNWLSIEIVKDNILEARGVKGNKLYTEKTPLYTIVLTPQTIKEIKAYNKDRSYSDFNLSCKNVNKSAACISTFIHKTLLSLGAINSDSDKSVNNCFKIRTTSDEADFKNCYEKNN